MSEEFKIEVNNINEVLRALGSNTLKALEECGLKAETFAKQECPVDTGALRNSCTHKVENGTEPAMYVGTNMEYAPYIEFGTGKYTLGGRKTPWVYEDSKGKWHITNGQRAKPFIKPAIANNTEVYKKIIEANMKN